MGCIKQDGVNATDNGSGLDFNPYESMQPRAPGVTPREMRNGARVKSDGPAPEGL